MAKNSIFVILFGITSSYPNNAAVTAANITANCTLFRIGFVSDLVMMACYLLTPLVFYRLFSMVDKNPVHPDGNLWPDGHCHRYTDVQFGLDNKSGTVLLSSRRFICKRWRSFSSQQRKGLRPL
jgi:hypothetical protein